MTLARASGSQKAFVCLAKHKKEACLDMLISVNLHTQGFKLPSIQLYIFGEMLL